MAALVAMVTIIATPAHWRAGEQTMSRPPLVLLKTSTSQKEVCMILYETLSIRFFYRNICVNTRCSSYGKQLTLRYTSTYLNYPKIRSRNRTFTQKTCVIDTSALNTMCRCKIFLKRQSDNPFYFHLELCFYHICISPPVGYTL